MDGIENLVYALDTLKTQGFPTQLPLEIVCKLQDIWDELQDHSDTRMNAAKLQPCRIENPVWENPCLTFHIERHGGIVVGSTRAEMYEWTINLATREASAKKVGHRQTYPMAPRYDPTKDCKKIIRLVKANANNPWLKWSQDRNQVTVRISEIVPRGHAKQTEAGRRRRFAAMLQPIMEAQGWQRVVGRTTHTYNKVTR